MFYLALPHVQFTFDMSSSASQTISPLVTHVRSSDKREIGSFTILNQSVPNNSRQKIIIIPLTLLLRGIIPRVPWDERRGAGKRRAAFLDGIYGLGSIPAWALGRRGKVKADKGVLGYTWRSSDQRYSTYKKGSPGKCDWCLIF